MLLLLGAGDLWGSSPHPSATEIPPPGWGFSMNSIPQCAQSPYVGQWMKNILSAKVAGTGRQQDLALYVPVRKDYLCLLLFARMAPHPSGLSLVPALPITCRLFMASEEGCSLRAQ